MKRTLLTFLFLLVGYCFLTIRAAEELVLLHAVWRHGDRTPTHTIPTDVNNTESTWPQGLGELTTMGMRQEFDLGKTLNSRYSTGGSVYSLISANYTQPQIYVRSDDYNRTLMSAMANLAGFFSNSTSGVVVQGWPAPYWQPIPVHTVNVSTDYLLDTGVPCPKAAEIYATVVMQQANYTAYAKQFQRLFTYLDSVCGFSYKLTLDTIDNVYDPLKAELNHREDGHEWPNYVNDSIFQLVKQARDIDDQFAFSNPEIARLRGGTLLGDIVNRMLQKQTSLNNTHSSLNWVRQLKYFMYSAHDDTLMALLSTLGAAAISGPGYPEYSACAVFELWKNDSNFFFIKSYYRSNSTSEFEPFQIDGCPTDTFCSLEQFYQRSVAFIPVNWAEECSTFATSTSTYKTTTPNAGQPMILYSEKILVLVMVAFLFIRLTSSFC